MGFKGFETGTYTISIVRRESVFESVQYINLKDEQSGLSSNISETSYSFVPNAGLREGRCETFYENGIVLCSGSAKRKEVLFYRDSNDFIVESASKIISNVEVYNILVD